MDSCDWSEQRFNEIKDSFVKLDNIFELIINNKFKSAQKSLHTK